jgi:hypothetical protein
LVAALLPLLALGLWTPGQAQTPEGQKHALLVGVRKYESVKFTELACTENDVNELEAVLTASGGFASVRVLSTARGEERREDAPTAENIRAEIRKLLARRKRQDTLLIALSGHGMQTAVREGGTEKNESFFCPSDAQLNDISTLIGLGQLFKDLDECGAGVKLLLVDACRNDPRLGRNVDLDTLPRSPRGTAALFSCKSGERAFESPELGKGHGVFFHFVLEGLRGKARNADGEVTWSRLVEHVTRHVSRAVPRLIGGGARQTPHQLANLEGESPVLIGPGEEGADPDHSERDQEKEKGVKVEVKEPDLLEAEEKPQEDVKKKREAEPEERKMEEEEPRQGMEETEKTEQEQQEPEEPRFEEEPAEEMHEQKEEGEAEEPQEEMHEPEEEMQQGEQGGEQEEGQEMEEGECEEVEEVEEEPPQEEPAAALMALAA